MWFYVQMWIVYGLVALSARSRYSSAFFRNSSAFDDMAESPHYAGERLIQSVEA
jgi:hypothetical protein